MIYDCSNAALQDHPSTEALQIGLVSTA